MIMNIISWFPLSERVKNGKFKKRFTEDSFKEVYSILIHYHNTLNEIEKQIEEKGIPYNSDEIFPKEKRLPLDNMIYIGCGKLPYFHFVNCLEKYHLALEYSEKILENNI